MYPGVELRVMRYIVAVARELHFGRAADRVHIAQPSMSKQIRLAEEDIGVAIFDRTRRKVDLTEPGIAFVENAMQSLLYAERAVAVARATAAGQQGKLLMGVSPAIDQRIFFDLRSAYAKRYPSVEVYFSSSFASQMAESIMRNELHVGLLELPIRYRGLGIIHLNQEPLVLAIPASHPLASMKTLTLEQLHGHTLALAPSDVDLSAGKLTEKLHALRCRPARILEVAAVAQALELAQAGEAVALLREHYRNWKLESVVYRSVPELSKFDTGLAYRRDSRSPHVKTLVHLVKEIFALERQQRMEKQPGK